MDEKPPTQNPSASPVAAPRTVPMAAVAGAIVLLGLVAFGLYRRHQTVPAAPAPTPSALAPGAEEAAGAAGEPAAGAAPGSQAPTPITASAPIRLSPEASILAERYRCVCGCNDTLSLCTCRNPRGSEEMKGYLQDLAAKKTSPAEADAAMAARFGAAALLTNPAPPQTLPSHAGSPPPAKR
jgi:hypothetical protein